MVVFKCYIVTALMLFKIFLSVVLSQHYYCILRVASTPSTTLKYSQNTTIMTNIKIWLASEVGRSMNKKRELSYSLKKYVYVVYV